MVGEIKELVGACIEGLRPVAEVLGDTATHLYGIQVKQVLIMGATQAELAPLDSLQTASESLLPTLSYIANPEYKAIEMSKDLVQGLITGGVK